MIFWGLVLSTITVFFLDPQNINLSLIFKIFKSATNQWFVIIYCILYMLIPFLNKLIKNINQKEYKVLLLIGLFFFYFWPSFYTKVTVNDGGYGIVNFIYLYFIGAYIRKYCKNSNTISKSLVLYLGCALVVALISFKADRAWDYCFIFNLLGSIALFRLFKSIKISYNIVINKLAKYTFSVYLIDTNEFFGKFLYRNLFHSNQYWNSNKMFINLIISVFGIYIICLILEILRRLILKKYFDWVVNKFRFEIKV